MIHILYELSKATDLFHFAENRMDKLKIAEEFFAKAPELIREMERGCGYNGDSPNRTSSA